MYFYHHLGKHGKKFVERPDGLPVIYSDRVLIQLAKGQAQQTINDKIRLLTQYVAVGFWVTAPSETPQSINEVLKIAPRAVFDTAYLTLKDNTANLINGMPLNRIEQVNAQGLPYYVTPNGFINLAESKLEVWNNAAITDEQDAILLHVDYVIPLGKHRNK